MHWKPPSFSAYILISWSSNVALRHHLSLYIVVYIINQAVYTISLPFPTDLPLKYSTRATNNPSTLSILPHYLVIHLTLYLLGSCSDTYRRSWTDIQAGQLDLQEVDLYIPTILYQRLQQPDLTHSTTRKMNKLSTLYLLERGGNYA